MVAGMEKYFQIAKAFRDEDLRADRQPEFTQIDIEASFVTPNDIYALTEGMLAAIFKAARGIEIPTPFPRLTYREAIDTFGSDKPDRRFDMKLIDLGDVFRSSQFKVFQSALAEGGVVKAINAKHFAGITIGQVDELTAIAKTFGAKGLAFIKVENGEWKSPIVKFFSEAEKESLRTRLQIEEGDCIFFAAGQMGDRLRSAWPNSIAHSGNPRKLLLTSPARTTARPARTSIFSGSPIFRSCNGARKKINGTQFIIHSPDRKRKTFALLEQKKFGEMRADAYDIVLNGVEIGGGSIRIHEPELAGKNVRSPRGECGRSAGKVWPFAARISPRRAAAWRHRPGSRSPRHADLRRRIHSRRDGVPEK